MTAKKRFGISIDYRLAELLDAVSKSLGMTRSQVVERALTTYLQDHAHLIRPHKCVGVLLGMCEGAPRERSIAHVAEEFIDVVVLHTHTHIEGKCVEIMLLRGDSRRISALHRAIREKVRECATRYIPLAMED